MFNRNVIRLSISSLRRKLPEQNQIIIFLLEIVESDIYILHRPNLLQQPFNFAINFMPAY